MQIQSKLPNVGTTIFTVMSQLAAEHRAINLSQGFPDFEAPTALIERVSHHMRQGMNQYAPMQGVPLLRERIARKVQALYQARIEPETEITVTAGATEALYAAITAVVRPGDEVIVLEPAYDSYVPAIQLSGGVPRFVPLTFPDYRVDWDRVRDTLTSRTRMIILNSPHNPTGTVLTADDITALEAISAHSDLFILSDEVYEHIIFDGQPHQSMLRHPVLAARSFVVSSFGKTYHTTGWKIGYCIAPASLSAELRKIHQFLTFTANTPVQLAYADFMKETGHYEALAEFYQNKRNLFRGLVRESRFKPLPCTGTYFQMLDYSAITDEPDIAFARRLTTAYGVAAIPPSVFYHDGRDHKTLRFCFAKQDQTLDQAAAILCRL
ncbi:MAG: pyridoxal phosphate-dependent aminotransferase [Desulfatitalea sp.]|nr:pyridoxal phosphate-dependent aminotransferase [Desulfatitalea sp.]